LVHGSTSTNQVFCKKSGNFTIFTAIRRASSFVSNFAADLRDVRLADRKTAVASRCHVNGGKDFVVDRTNTNVFIGSAERELLRSLS
jgi:hypothetical protein